MESGVTLTVHGKALSQSNALIEKLLENSNNITTSGAFEDFLKIKKRLLLLQLIPEYNYT